MAMHTGPVELSIEPLRRVISRWPQLHDEQASLLISTLMIITSVGGCIFDNGALDDPKKTPSR